MTTAALVALERRGTAPSLLQAQGAAGTLAALSAFGACAISGDLGRPLIALFLGGTAGAVVAAGRFAHRYELAWSTLLVGALLVLGLHVLSGDLDLVLGAARFVVLLALHRLWNRRHERDELLLLLLSLLMLCAGAALSAELLFGFAFAAFAVTATWSLALTHLRWRLEEARGPVAEALLHSRRLVTPRLLGGLAMLSLLGLAGAVAIFFIFPRVTLGGLRRASRPQQLAGLAETIELSGQGTLPDDPRVVLRVTLTPDPGVSELEVHFRARALEAWTGRGWRGRDDAREPASWLKAPPRRLRAAGPQLVADLEAVAGASDGLVLTPPGWPLSVRFLRPISARGSPYQLLRDGAGDLFYQPIEIGDLRYQVTLQPVRTLEASEPIDAAALPEEVAADLDLPADLDPRVRALGEGLVRGKPVTEAAKAVQLFLGKGFSYSRELPGEVADPVADFLFRRRQGHCELFSTAMVLLLRAGGVPARNVTGYYGGVRSAAGYYAVRAGDAHSWVEAWLPGLGWQAWDPTPPSERGSRQDGLWASAVLLWDGLAASWRGSVVDFDLLSQGQALRRAAELLQEAGRRLSGRARGAAPMPPALALEAAGLVALAGLALALRRRRRAQVPTGPVHRLDADALRARALFRAARARLQRSGLALADSATPAEVAGAADRRLPAAAPSLKVLLARCSAARWGGAALPPADARRLLRELARAL